MIKKYYKKKYIGYTKKPSVLKVIPLGGLEEVGKNMTVLEYGQDILIIDMGLQFPTEEMLGIDYVIPDISYLQDKKDRIKGVVITHGHYDHIGAIPYLLPKLDFPKIYATKLTKGMIEKLVSEYDFSNKVTIHSFVESDILYLGPFRLEFFHVNHNIPDGVGIGVFTPVGLLVFTGDFKFDNTPINEKPTNFTKIASLAGQGVLALFSDSTNAESPGFAVSEQEIKKIIDRLFAQAKGRIIFSSFASLIARIQEVIESASKYGRKIAVSGRSMANNIEIAAKLGYLKYPEDIFIKINEINKYPDNKIVILCTGSQGEDMAALSRMARGEHKHVQIRKGDTVILSSSIIPGNERSVFAIYDNLLRQGAEVIYEKIMDIHTGGHAKAEELKMMIRMVSPKYFIPIHGERHMLEAHKKIAQDLGLPQENIFVADNGQIIEFSSEGGRLTDRKVPTSYVMVDGLGVGDVGQIVLRDRQAMAKDGVFVIIVTVDHKTGRLVTSPDIISRGFVYMKESEKLIADVRQKIKKLMASGTKEGIPADWSHIKMKIREEIGQFLYDQTERRPMVLPVVIEV